MDGLSYADIAAFLGVTKTTVRGRLQRGRAQLRKELTMVERTFKEHELPRDFSAEINGLLDAAAARGKAHEKAIKRLAEIGAPAVDPLCAPSTIHASRSVAWPPAPSAGSATRGHCVPSSMGFSGGTGFHRYRGHDIEPRRPRTHNRYPDRDPRRSGT